MNSDTFLKTPLHTWHVSKNAKMASFAGWDMPIQYTGILAEHQHTREKASIFDICHMGEFLVNGKNALEHLAKVVSTNLATLAPGRCRYGFLLNEQGGIMDDLIVYHLKEDHFLMVVNAGCRASDFTAVRSRLPKDIMVQDISDKVGKIDLQGPSSLEVLNKLGAKLSGNFKTLPYFGFTLAEYKRAPILISRTGYTGEFGFELYLSADKTEELWLDLLEDETVAPAGLGARDTLRLEAGLPLYGQDLDEGHTPAEAGYATMLTSEAEYAGKAGAKNIKEQLVALQIPGRRSARHGNAVLLPGSDKPVGIVTSGSFAPSLGNVVALAYINKDAAENNEFIIQADKVQLTASKTTLPFYTKGTARIKLG